MLDKQRAKNAETFEMQQSVSVMERKEKQRAYLEAKEKGEEFAPDGRPIPENQNNGIRPNDPRTPITFGNTFARVNDVEESVESIAAKNGLGKDELAKLGNGTEIVWDDIYSDMLYHKVEPRHMCGVDLEHAANMCGPTCDPSYEFCIMGFIDDIEGYQNGLNGQTGQYENWGRCYQDVMCMDPTGHEAILDDENGCNTRLIQSPCANPCDCLRKEKNECRKFCSLSDTHSILRCKILRNKGKKKRELIVANALANVDACDYNVFYEHPLMHSELLEPEKLPGLFGTF